MKRFALAATVATGLLASASSADAAQLFSWTFEGTGTPTSFQTVVNGTTGVATADMGAVAPEVNPSGIAATLTAHHATANAKTHYSGGGNGSPGAYYSASWTTNDYDQIAANLTGYSAFVLSLDVSGSNTGPGSFKVQYTLNGTDYTDFGSYAVPAASGASIPFSTTAYNSALHFDIAMPANVADVQGFRIVDSAATTGGNVVGGNVGATGTSRIDNLTVSGVPEPGSLAVVAAGGLLAQRRRRPRR